MPCVFCRRQRLLRHRSNKKIPSGCLPWNARSFQPEPIIAARSAASSPRHPMATDDWTTRGPALWMLIIFYFRAFHLPFPVIFSITTYFIQCAGAPLVLYQGGRLCAETCNPAMHPKTVGSRTSDTSCEHVNPSQREPPFGKPLPAQTHPPAAFLRKPTSQLLIQSMTCKMQNSLSLLS